jgi:hypothetical protein
MGKWRYSSTILNLGARWRRDPDAFPGVKQPPVLIV